MSNFLFNGFEFDELNSSFKLQNVCPIYSGETGQMKLPLLNNQNSGYVLNTSTLYNNNPDFLLNQQIDTNIVTLLKYDGTNDIFKFYKNINLQNSSRISNSLDPINDKDLVTKSFLESSIGSFGDGSVTSVGVSTSTNGLSITGSPITVSGTININLSNQLQNLSSLGMGSANQVLATGASNNFVWKSVGTVTSVGINTPINSGIIITNTPIIDLGNINIDLASNLKAFNTLGYGLNGQVLTIDNGGYSWVTPLSGGNVTGSSATVVNGLALWNNTTGTSLGSTGFTLDVNGNLNLNSKRIVSAQDPVSAQDYITKNYIDTLISNTFRTGNVAVGDIGGTSGTVNLTVSGGVLAATKRNGYYSTGDSFIDITYADKGYIPNIFVFVLNNMPSSSANDISVPVLQSSTNTTARIYLEESQSVIQSVTLNIMLIKPNLT